MDDVGAHRAAAGGVGVGAEPARFGAFVEGGCGGVLGEGGEGGVGGRGEGESGAGD